VRCYMLTGICICSVIVIHGKRVDNSPFVGKAEDPTGFMATNNSALAKIKSGDNFTNSGNQG